MIMDLSRNRSLAIFCGLCILSLTIDSSGAVDITVAPQDACVCSGQPVQFNCTAEVERSIAGGGTILQTASQRWEITTSESTVNVVSPPLTSIPAGYEFVSVNSVPPGRPTGLTVLSPDTSLNQATFTCTGYDPQGPDVESMPTPEITLEVGGFPEFQCSVSCPLVYSSVSDSCTVQWTTPVTASCESVTEFSVMVSGNGITTNSSVQDAASLSYMTEVLEPFQSYTATVTVMNSCGSSSQCSVTFMSPREERPVEFDVELPFITNDKVIITAKYPIDSPAVREFSVVITDTNDQEILIQSFSGNSSSLSLDISSLQQCMSYTVSVTATNTGGSRTASAMLSLGFLTSLMVSCEADIDSCYLEATCVTGQSELVSGCMLTYTNDGGSSQSVVSQNGELTLRVAVPCDAQTIFYEGQFLSQTMTLLGCRHIGTAKCPNMKDCGVLHSANGTVTYSTTGDLTNGTVATYFCDDGYELVGEEMRTCLIDGTWTGAEPECEVIPDLPTEPQLASFLGLVIVIVILAIVVVAMAIVIAVLMYIFKCRGVCKAESQTRREQEGVEMSENVSYGPVKQSTIPSSGGSTAVPEYEELSDIHQRGVELKTGAHLETGGSGSKVEYEEVEPPRVQ